MVAELLAVGTELLMGLTTNTNARYISSKLPDAGINVFFHTVVGDNAGRLAATLKTALTRSDIVIMTGGLGPTMDDLTKETVAACFGKKLVLHQKSLEYIKERFMKMGNRQMTKNNEKQAYFPEGAIILENENGTAPGCILEDNGKTVILLPGPPSEMQPMFDHKIMPYLMQYADYRLDSKFIRVFGIGESMLEDMLKDLFETQNNPTLATYAKEGEVMLRVTARYQKNAAAEQEDILTPVVSEITRRLGDYIYSYDNEDMESHIFRLMKDRKLTLSLAESCTGGMNASRLTTLPGSSEVLLMSAVTYCNDAKHKALGVREETLSDFGAVSAETAVEMAAGARERFGSDVAVAVTGIAGPGGGSPEKPVGLVYLALADKDGVRTKRILVPGGRHRVRNSTCLHAFDMIRRAIQGLQWIE